MLYLLVTFLRVSDGHPISLSEAFIRDLHQQPCFANVEQLCQALEQYYSVSFSEAEMRYLQVFFISLQSGDKTEDENRQQAEAFTQALLRQWEQQLPYSFAMTESCTTLYFTIYALPSPVFAMELPLKILSWMISAVCMPIPWLSFEIPCSSWRILSTAVSATMKPD